MSALQKLTSVNNKPYNGFTKLSEGFHEIVCFRATKNKFAKKGEGSSKSIIVELKDEIVFLPQYFGTKISESDIKELNASKEKIFLYFGGKNEETG